MKSKYLIIIGVYLFCLPSISSSADLQKTISLKDAIESALQKNLNLKLQEDAVSAAQGTTLSSSGKFDYIFQAEATAQSNESTPLYTGAAEQEDSESFNAEISKIFTTGTAISLEWSNSGYDTSAESFLLNPSYSSGLTLGLKQPLLKGFGEEVQTAGIRANEKQVEAATEQLGSETVNLVADVKKAYWSLVYNYQNIEVQKLSLTLANKLLEETDAQVSAGKLAPVEIYQPQSEVARREEQLISAEQAVGTAEDNLKLLMNSEDWLVTFVPTDSPANEPVSLNLPAIVKNAMQNRPDLRAADLQTQAVELELNRAKDEMRPDLSLIGAIGIGGTDASYGDALDDSVNDPNNEWQVGLSFTVPLENSAAKGYYQKIQADLNRAKHSAELLRLQTQRSVRTTVRNVQLAIKALEATQKTSLATLKRLEAEQAKFDSGRSTTLDVLTAQEAYAQALSQENLTKINYANSLAELDRIQGLVTYTSAQK